MWIHVIMTSEEKKTLSLVTSLSSIQKEKNAYPGKSLAY